MPDEKVWTDEQVAQATEKIDELIVLDGVAEMVDGPTIKILLNTANNLISKHAPKWSWGMIQAGMAAFLAWEKPVA